LARAAIKLSVDISPDMPRLSGQIEGCAYNSDSPAMAFRVRKMGIVIHPNEINVHRAENEDSAPQVIGWLKELLSNPELKLSCTGELTEQKK
jgi:hypothetical protein